MRLLSLPALVLTGFAWIAGGDPLRAADPDVGLEFFEKRIRPVLVEHCYGCHAVGKKKQGGLLLDSRAGIRKGGDTGPAVVPSVPDESLLLSAMRYEDFEMPPKGRLPAKIIRDFERWIRIGAPDPRDGGTVAVEPNSPSVEEGRSYWAFQPVRPVKPAPVRNASWPRSEIDRLILAQIEERGLAPAADAAPEVLLRRLFFDLTGLPPSPGEIATFLDEFSTDRKKAVERVVDRLLNSPQFGERWGRHWLDVVRFAESSGGGRTRIFEHAWRYRDYVVRAFGQDKPYDRFVKEQIAGDLLPTNSIEDARAALTATSFLAIAPTNYELQDKELLDMDVVDEQLTVTGKAFLGMTIGCARCHDHKFDPIPTRDYYALAGIFRSTKTLNHANVSNPILRELPLDEDQKSRRTQLVSEMEPLRKEIAKLDLTLKRLSRQEEATQLTLDNLLGLSADESGESNVAERSLPVPRPAAVKRSGTWNRSTSIPGFVGAGYHYSNDQSASIAYSFPLAQPATLEVRISYTAASNRAPNVPVTIRHAGGETVKRVDMTKKPGIDGTFVSLGRFEFGDAAVLVISAQGTRGAVIADAVQLLPAPAAAGTAKAPRSGVVIRKESAADRERRVAELEQVKGQKTLLQEKLKALEKGCRPLPS